MLNKLDYTTFSEKSDPMDILLSSIKNIGHPEYPILDRTYSPNSRVPCTDLVPFISQRIMEGDKNSIKILMRSVVESSFSFVGFNWIDESVEKILSIPFDKYLFFSSKHAIPELQALLIVAAKSGGSREFQIIEENTIRLISQACIAYQPQWLPRLNSLTANVTSWKEKIGIDSPYWQEYERLDIKKIHDDSVGIDLRKSITALTPAARLQLFYVIERGGGSLPELTNYPIRSLGINVDKTSKELLESELVLPSFSSEAIESTHTKQDLLNLCEFSGASYRKSWKKEKLVRALEEINPSALEEIAKNKNLVSPNFQTFRDLEKVVSMADNYTIGFKLLCFA